MRKSLNNNQHAYLTERSTATVLSSAVSLIKAQVEKGGFAIGFFTNIEGAFNKTIGAIIQAALRRFEVPVSVRKLLGHMLTRTLKMKQPSESRRNRAVHKVECHHHIFGTW